MRYYELLVTATNAAADRVDELPNERPIYDNYFPIIHNGMYFSLFSTVRNTSPPTMNSLYSCVSLTHACGNFPVPSGLQMDDVIFGNSTHMALLDSD